MLSLEEMAPGETISAAHLLKFSSAVSEDSASVEEATPLVSFSSASAVSSSIIMSEMSVRSARIIIAWFSIPSGKIQSVAYPFGPMKPVLGNLMPEMEAHSPNCSPNFCGPAPRISLLQGLSFLGTASSSLPQLSSQVPSMFAHEHPSSTRSPTTIRHSKTINALVYLKD